MTIENRTPSLNYLDMHTLIYSLKKNKWIILSITLCLFISCMSYVIFKPEKYLSTTLLLIQESSFKLSEDQQHNLATSLIRSEPIATEIALIRSNLVLESVIQDLHLNTRYPESSVLEKIQKKLSIINLTHVSDNNENKSNILQLSLIGKDPTLTADILNKIALTTQEQNIQRKKAQAEHLHQFLSREIETIRKSLLETEAQLNQYRAIQGKIDVTLQTQYLLNRMMDIDKQIDETTFKKMHLLQQNTEEHPYVITLTDKIRELKKEKNTLMNALKKLPNEYQTIHALERDVNVKKNMYVNLLHELQSLAVIKMGLISDIQILSPAKIADRPVSKHLMTTGIVIFFISLMLGCLSVLVMKMTRMNH